MSKRVNVEGHDGVFVIRRSGKTNTRVEPVDGGESFLVPTEKIKSLEGAAESAPSSQKVIPPTPSPQRPPANVETAPVFNVALPTSDGSYWARVYSSASVEKKEWASLEDAVSELNPLLAEEGVIRLGEGTFRTPGNVLYELHGFRFSDFSSPAVV